MAAILTLNQLKEVTHAYDAFTTVADSNLPDYYKEIFPHTCECGGEVIFTVDSADVYGYTQLQCCNPDCWIKMAHRFAYFAKSLGFKGFGSAGALSIYRELHTQFKYPTFLSIFLLPDTAVRKINGDAYGDEFEAMRNSLRDSVFQLKDAIVALGIQDIGKGSSIFDVVKDPVVLLDFVLKSRTEELCDIAGINALKTRFALRMARLDIVTLMSDVMPHICGTPKNEMYVAITGSVSVDGHGFTRPEFIWKCESILDSQGNPMYKLVETKAMSKLDYVIADFPSNSSKYQLGKKLGKLITANDFYHMLEANAGGGSHSE